MDRPKIPTLAKAARMGHPANLKTKKSPIVYIQKQHYSAEPRPS
jgi:hypothetical protein